MFIPFPTRVYVNKMTFGKHLRMLQLVARGTNHVMEELGTFSPYPFDLHLKRGERDWRLNSLTNGQ